MRPNQSPLQKKPITVVPVVRPQRGKSALSSNCRSHGLQPQCDLNKAQSLAGDNDCPQFSPTHQQASEVEEEPKHQLPRETSAGWKRGDNSVGRTTSAIQLRKVVPKPLDETIKISLHHPSLSSSESVKVPLGFPNLGNSCFLNSALIALYSLTSFRQFIQSTPSNTGPVTTQLRRFFLQSPGDYRGEEVARRLLSLIAGFNDGRQHCTYSFILHLLNSLDTELRSEGEISRLSDLLDSLPLEKYRVGKCAQLHKIFSVLIENLFICSQCKANISFSNYSYGRTMDLPVPQHFQSLGNMVLFSSGNFYLRNSPQMYISKDRLESFLTCFRSLSLPKTPYLFNSKLTLSTCFDYCLRATLMTAGNELPCLHCGATRHYKQPFLRHLGNVLVLHFQRYDEATGDKLETKVPFEDSLDLSAYIPGSQVYDLKAVVYHSGTLYFGHYTATIRLNGSWYSFNDRIVSEVSRPAVENAYLLFYEARICR